MHLLITSFVICFSDKRDDKSKSSKSSRKKSPDKDKDKEKERSKAKDETVKSESAEYDLGSVDKVIR